MRAMLTRGSRPDEKEKLLMSFLLLLLKMVIEAVVSHFVVAAIRVFL